MTLVFLSILFSSSGTGLSTLTFPSTTCPNALYTTF